jgi:hypothetical protein
MPAKRCRQLAETMVKHMSKEQFRKFLNAVLNEDKVSEIVINFKYDNSLKFRWTPEEEKKE